MRRNTLYPAQLHGPMDHHGGRTLAGTCPKPTQAPDDATPRPHPAISNRESTVTISNRESRVGAGVNLPPALASGVRPNVLQQKIRTDQTETIPKHKKHPSKFVSVRKNSALYFLQLSEILIEPMFRLERESSQRGAKRKRSSSSPRTPACGRCSCHDEEPKESKARFVSTFTISRRYSGVKAEVVKGRETAIRN